MADTKISALTGLAGANIDTAADVLPIVDTSVATTKKTTVDDVRISLSATQALQEAGTNVSTFVMPSVQHFHPSAAKAWVYFTQSGTTITVEKSYNVDGVVRNSNGNYTVTFTTDFSDAEYCFQVAQNGDRSIVSDFTLAAGTFTFQVTRTVDSAPQEVSKASCTFWGDHA